MAKNSIRTVLPCEAMFAETVQTLLSSKKEQLFVLAMRLQGMHASKTDRKLYQGVQVHDGIPR